jgi:hypothetical protein
VSLIAASGRRMSVKRLMAELTLRGFAHPKSTVQHALASLVKRGILESSRRSPRGYSLAQPGPLSAKGDDMTA